MSRRSRWLALLALLAVTAGLNFAPDLRFGLVAAQQDASEADERDRHVMERFLTVLEKTPRRGTALDRVYGYHVERGTIEQLVKKYRDRAAEDQADGAAWMIVGLIEAQRGRDAAAVEAFRKAEENTKDGALPAYYLGQSLVLVGQPDAAAEAFERAIARRPSRVELLEIFQALGRVYQRAHRNEQAMAVWGRLEQVFPDDLRVQEEIASTLAEEGQHEEALKRYEALTKKTKDDQYRQVVFRMQAAELKVKLARKDDALADFETLLASLNPDNWLFREVRRSIEEVFLRSDDQAGLAKYYEGWIENNKDDIEAMTRLGRTLAILGRLAEAQEWFDRAIKLAPSRRELRLALIEQFVRDGKFADAVAQYEALNKVEPNNPDTVREWGRMILKDKSRPEDERKSAAAAVWQRLIDARPKDALIATQVADLFRQAEMTDAAIAQYQRAIELAPESAQYREYLGEYYHNLKRPDDAATMWREIAAGKNRTAKNLARLAEVFAGFGYKAEAVDAIAEAASLEKDEFPIQLKYADLLHAAERYDDAIRQLDAVATIAEGEEEHEAVLVQQIKNFQAANKLGDEIATLCAKIAAAPSPPTSLPQSGERGDAAAWRRLARYLEADRKLDDATRAIKRAIELDEKSIPAWATAARIYESAGSLLAAADANRRLATIDRRNRTEYLTNVAKLEARLGRRDAALQAGRDLIAAAPGNPENYQFFAELCFQLGQVDKGLDGLRRAVRVNPTDPKALLTLAAALAERFRTDEAIELYWQAFAKSTDLDGKLAIVSALTTLYLQTNHFDKLIERLERERREPEQQREMTICLAAAYQAASDFGTARQELERLLAANNRDTKLLGQLSSLAETERDIAAAAKYQRALNELAPSKDGEARLAQLYLRTGETSEAETIWVQIASGEQEPHRALEALNSLLANSKHETVLTLTERMLRDNPRNWEVLYREGVALNALEKADEAARRFQAILDLRLTDNEKSEIAKARERKPPAGRPAGISSRPAFVQAGPLQQRMSAVYEIRRSAGLDTRSYYGPSQTWSPLDFGQARMAALAWLVNFAEKKGKHEEFINEHKVAADAATAELQPAWDMYYLQLVRQDQKAAYEAARLLSKKSRDPAAQWTYLNSLAGRTATPGQQVVRRSDQPNVDNTPPLADDELNHVLDCFRDIAQTRRDWIAGTLNNVVTELKRAKRTEDEEKIYRDGIETASELNTIPSVLGMAATRGDVDTCLALFDKLAKLNGPSSRNIGGYAYNPLQESASWLAQAMKPRADAKAHADIPRIVDHYLAAAREQKKNAPPGRGGVYNPYASSAGRSYVQIYTAGQYSRSVQLDFPQPNDYFDYGAIMLLRNAFEFFRRDDLVSDLFAHFRAQLDRSAVEDRIYPHLALAYMHWWNDEKDQSLAELGQAAELKRDDLNMQLEVADIRERNGQPAEALDLIDAIEPTDNTTMRRREIAALRVSVTTGNVTRARQAAERLFGLQLDSDLQMQLAQQMTQLGMHEMADAVLGRARRRAGNRGSSLVTLMMQYQAQNKPDVAVQIAHQILRAGPSQQSVIYGPGYRGEDDVARDQAIQMLARSGKLKELTERAEAQIKASPNSVQLHQTLADLYRAAGQRDKVKDVYEKMVALRPDDPRLRYQVASQLVQAGDAAKAVELYKLAFKKEPALYARNYNEVQNAFQRANKLDELVQLMEEMDLKAFGSYYQVANLVRSMVDNEKTREQGMKLFRKLWAAFPNDRGNVLGYLYNDEIWRLPEMYNYAREALIPTESQALAQPWSGMDRVLSWMGDGRVSTVVSRLVEATTKQNKLDELRKDVEATVAKLPQWKGGRALAVVLLARAGQTDQAKQSLEELLADDKAVIPPYARIVIGQELENYAALEPLVVKLYEAGIKGMQEDENMEYQWSPAKRLVELYKRTGRVAEAREMVLKFTKRASPEYDPQYQAYRKINDLNSIAGQLFDLGYPADAVRMYNEVLSDTGRLTLGNQVYGGENYLTQQAQQGLNQALAGLNAETLGRTLKELLKPAAEKDGASGSIDLVLVIQPRDLDRTAVSSMLSSAIQAAATTPGVMDDVYASVSKLLEERSQDLSVQVAAALAAFASGKDESIAESVARLAKLADEMPLESLPAGARANARQRAEAAKQLSLWLVAREAWKHDAVRATGDKLAERAMEAARRQADAGWSLAMHRELGSLALERGDRAAAEQHWTKMLEAVVGREIAGTKRVEKEPEEESKQENGGQKNEENGCNGNGSAVRPFSVFHLPVPNYSVFLTLASPQATTAIKQPPAPAAREGGGTAVSEKPNPIPPLSLDKFDQAARIAKLAAENDMHELSLRAIVEATRGGPPIPANPQNQRFGMTSLGRMMSGANPAGASEDPTVSRQVEAKLSELDALWKRHGVPAVDVYETLAGMVLPEARPAEVFLFQIQLTYSGVERPRSVAALAVRWAAAAGKSDDLRRRIESRLAQPLAELNARILLGQLGLASKDKTLVADCLAWLDERLKKDSLQNTAELACHVAMPALAAAETTDAALPIVERAAQNMVAQANTTDEPVGSLLTTLARLHFARNNADEGRRSLQDYLAAVDRSSIRYGGDYGPYRRKMANQKVATEFARAGLVADALDMLGQYADAPRYRYGEPTGPGLVVGLITRQLAARPAAERFDLIKNWTMPVETRKSVRLVASFVPTDSPPAVFGKAESGERTAEGQKEALGIASSALDLIDSAREAGKLDELAAELQTLADDKVENARLLLVLVQIARGASEAVESVAKELADELPKKIPPQNDSSRRIEFADYLVARACFNEAKLGATGERMMKEMLTHSQRTQDHLVQSHLRDDFARSTASRAGGTATRDAGLALWQPTVHQSAAYHQAGTVPGWWVEHDGQIGHITGPEWQSLYFNYPLAGTFEFSFDGWTGGWSESHFGYAGLSFEITGWNSNGLIWPVGHGDEISRPCRFIRNDGFNRFSVGVQPDKIRVEVNGHLFYEDKDPSPTNPWLALFTGRERQTVWKNLKIAGAPEIPREVALTKGDRMEGWISGFFYETQPPRRSIAPAADSPKQLAAARTKAASTNLDDFDWAARDGVVYGRRSAASAQVEALQSRLYYHRPMRAGESIRYEFYYEPDSIVVHPALDRLTFLLEPDGVRLHWITDGADDSSGLKPGNVADEPSNRRGPKSLPLKPGEWNAVKLALSGDATTTSVVLELNGVEVYERELEPTSDRLFGFFHYKDRTSSQVRNVVLSGDWPERLTPRQLAALTARADANGDAAGRRVRSALIGERFAGENAENLLRRARTLQPEQRYADLLRWVLPADDHAAFRLYGSFTPADPAPPVAGGSDSRGGALEAPALELVSLARQTGRLDELAALCAKAATNSIHEQRAKLAILAVIRIAQDRDDDALKLLEQLKPLLTQVAADEPEWARWPEVIAVSQSLDRPKLLAAARDLVEHMVTKQIQNAPVALSEPWRRQVYHLAGRGHALVQPEAARAPFGTAPKLDHWVPAARATAATRGTGAPPAHWTFHNGELKHYHGHNHDQLYFRVPLAGNFELSCELFGWREVNLAYGGRQFGLGWHRKDFWLSHFGQEPRVVQIAPPLEGVDYSYKYRLVVQDGNSTVYVNDRKMHEERLPANPDPWLVLYQPWGHFGGLRDLKITGNPNVPDRLELSNLPDLTGWLADYYEDLVSGENKSWQKRGEEIFGRAFTETPGSKQESVLQYHRPLFEDGSIEYEFFYDPGKVATHPSLDRLVFLLEPDGVKVHWLTNGKYERSGLAPENVTVEAANRRGPAELPLKPREWNKLKLAINEDAVAVELNGERIYERELEPTNQRTFGLFHFADDSEVRVRNVIHRGAWPRSLPAVQELAGPAATKSASQ